MNFLLDENFPKSAGVLLVNSGHRVIDTKYLIPRGADDSFLFNLAQAHEAILLTTDRDFYHTIPHTYPEHFGAIVIALKLPNREAILARLDWILAQEMVHNMRNTVILLRDHTYRIRRKQA